MDWLVVYVKSRAEKKVAERLRKAMFEVFCPLKLERRKWSDRIKVVEVPYFGSYVFVRCKMEERLTVLSIPGIVYFVKWLDSPAIIKDKEMESVIAFFKEFKGSEILSQSFEKGDEVCILNGAFSEINGVILNKTKHHVTLEIQRLGLTFKVLVATENIKKLPSQVS